MLWKISPNSDMFPHHGQRLHAIGLEIYNVIKESKSLWVVAPINTFDTGSKFYAAKGIFCSTDNKVFKLALDKLLADREPKEVANG